EPPALVVYVSVDQLRGDLLEHYDSLFTGGFRRLHDGGLRFTGATHDHAKTATAPGHATLGTGVFPSRSGIVANEWLERTPEGWRSVYCVEDTLSHILGYPAMEGRSPRNFLRDGLADWILAVDSGAIIVSASRKDRAAIGMAARAPGHIYWIAENHGRFVTSSHYADAYPGWVERFNLEEMPRIFGDSVWEQTLSPEERAFSRRDTVAYEGDGVHTFFPHTFAEEGGDPSRPGALNRWAYAQMHPDEAVAAFAEAAVRELALGQDGSTDYLALSFSQTDDIGHNYGPFSREQLENLIHLDGLLGHLMDHLDEFVGGGKWLMALTADHGALAVPEYLSERGEVGSRPTARDLPFLRGVFQAHRGREGDPLKVADTLVAELEALPFIADAFPVAEMNGSPSADSFSILFRNSFHPDRWHWGYQSQGSGVLFRFVEALYPDSIPRGTGHGSPYFYDRHVPLVFYGTAVDRGVSDEKARTVDIAPTLGHLVGIAMPADLDGVPLFQ
ncbi:MAG: alkaline phosphatase family protein, partial [Gemmatimonadetes bacterium]|nr:alkaline phosphatase family protein [Gemmatimonadota bacterium]